MARDQQISVEASLELQVILAFFIEIEVLLGQSLGHISEFVSADPNLTRCADPILTPYLK
jgi:hypothetical protein